MHSNKNKHEKYKYIYICIQHNNNYKHLKKNTKRKREIKTFEEKLFWVDRLRKSFKLANFK